MKDICFIFLFLFSSLSSSYAQLVGFEESVPQTFKVAGKGELKTSSLFIKREKVVWNGTFSRGQHWTFKCPLYL